MQSVCSGNLWDGRWPLFAPGYLYFDHVGFWLAKQYFRHIFVNDTDKCGPLAPLINHRQSQFRAKSRHKSICLSFSLEMCIIFLTQAEVAEMVSKLRLRILDGHEATKVADTKTQELSEAQGKLGAQTNVKRMAESAHQIAATELFEWTSKEKRAKLELESASHMELQLQQVVNDADQAAKTAAKAAADATSASAEAANHLTKFGYSLE